ncbi:MAG: DUF2478 domain-containing protein [Hyphomicrobiaceae bacterium]
MKEGDNFLAAVIYSAGEGEAVDRTLSCLARELEGRGYKIAGTVQRSIPRSSRCTCDMMVRDLSADREVQISEDRGPNARGCRLDSRVLEGLVGSTLSALDRGVDAVIINKFGKQEARGAGFRGVIAQTILRPTPVITSVNSAYFDSWRLFADGLADELKPDRNILVDWITRRLRTDVVRRDSFAERPSLGEVL